MCSSAISRHAAQEIRRRGEDVNWKRGQFALPSFTNLRPSVIKVIKDTKRRRNTMSLNIDKLAEQIATLDRTEQEALFEKVAELTFQRGLKSLSRQYRERLAQEGKLDRKADEVMAEIEQIREEIAAHNYRA
jgi:hypothetical protein